ncbi:unnamed protein product [Musa acuminata subsp. malaccensis]|uniref:(wild Malaysian banana) hypothetical protein n=1 Tax=Musa acuminata subsp. malaccensis TaxID=214687 RepID=A0A804KL62_MUSAM|nr:unnamed protein product [Musa acuminata subsp. malaccensis]
MGARRVVVNVPSGATCRTERLTWGGVLRQIRGVTSSQFFTPIIYDFKKFGPSTERRKRKHHMFIVISMDSEGLLQNLVKNRLHKWLRCLAWYRCSRT